MNEEHAFGARWCVGVNAVSWGLTAVFAVLGLRAIGNQSAGLPWTDSLVALIPLLLMIPAAAFAIRGYVVAPESLFVRRPGWWTRIPLAGLVSVTADAEAMKRSLRIFGNGGLFSITGLMYNQRLGRYRAFATNPPNAVVLRFADRVVVVTPDNPAGFAAAIRAAAHLPDIP